MLAGRAEGGYGLAVRVETTIRPEVSTRRDACLPDT